MNKNPTATANKNKNKIKIGFHFSSSSTSSLRFSLESNLTDEQLAMQELALDFMESKLKPSAKNWDLEKCISYDIIREAADLGFAGLYTSEEYNGLGLSRLDSSLIFESLAQGCVSTTALLTIHNMTAWMLDTFGSVQLKDEYLKRMVSCELMGSYCLTEPHCGSDAAALKTSAKFDAASDEYIINGSKSFISGAGVHDLYFVMCRTEDTGNSSSSSTKNSDNITCFVIPKESVGISFGENEIKMGWKGSPTAMVFFDDCRVPKANMIGELGKGFKIAMKALDGGRLGIASCSLGAAQRCLQDAIAYSFERQAFNQSLNEFQSIQFELSELAIELHSARLLLRDAAMKYDEEHEEKTMFCAMAKKKVTDIGFEICDRSLQIFGGYGYLHDYEIERFVRDSRVNRILEGTNEIMNVVIARRILDPRLNGL